MLCTSISLANSSAPPGRTICPVAPIFAAISGIARRRHHVGRDAVAQFLRHAPSGRTGRSARRSRAPDAPPPSRSARPAMHRRALAVGDRDHLDLPGLHLRPHDRVGRDVKLDAPFGEIVDRLHGVAIGHARDVGAGLLEEAGGDEIVRAGGATAMLSLPGSALARASRSSSELMPSEAGTPTATTVLLTRAIGTRSFTS